MKEDRGQSIRDRLLAMQVGDERSYRMEEENLSTWRVKASDVRGHGGRVWRFEKEAGIFKVSCERCDDALERHLEQRTGV